MLKFVRAREKRKEEQKDRRKKVPDSRSLYSAIRQGMVSDTMGGTLLSQREQEAAKKKGEQP